MSKVHVRTIKLKLRVIDKNEYECWTRLRQISSDAWKAANWIASGQFMNDQMMRRIYARKKIDIKNEAEVNSVEEQFRQFFGTKRQATTERDIKEAFPNLPSCVTNPLNRIVVTRYNKDRADLHSGHRSLRTYRKGMPIQTTKAAVQFYRTEKDHCFKWKLSKQEALNFAVLFGKDKANHRATLNRIFEGINDYSAPQIQLKHKDLFLLLPVKEPASGVDLDPELSIGVDLGMAVPVYVGLSRGFTGRAIGDVNDFLKIRTQMQNRKRQIQRSLKSVSGGKGRKKKLKALDRLKAKEANFMRTYNHFVSSEIVNFAVKHSAGVIKTEMLEGFGDIEGHEFFLRNWSYFDLHTLIAYKAKRLGIKVVKVDPYQTSQTCSTCGYLEKDQRTNQTSFQCKHCGKKMNADYNAALNIARSNNVVTKKEQCKHNKRKIITTSHLKKRVCVQNRGKGKF